MMQWLRAHTKQIMVVVVLMAMLAFIGDQALMNILSASDSNTKFAKIFGSTVRTGDLIGPQRDLQILERLGFQLNFTGTDNVSSQHFFMLVSEAKAAGLKVSQAEVDEELKTRGRTADELAMLQPRQVFAPTNIYEAVGNYILINKNAERVLRATAPSEAEARHYAVDTEERVKIKSVVFDASKFVDAGEVIPEAEIQAQFDKYKNTLKGEGDDGYGYKHPARVKVQCIVADFAKIEAMITVSLEEASAHWRKNKSAYTIQEKVPTSMPDAGAPLIQPSEGETMVSREKLFSEARAQVESEIKKKRAAQAAEQAMRKLSSELLNPWHKMPTDKTTGLKPIPDSVKEPTYLQALRNQTAAEFGVVLDYLELGPMPRDELARHPVVGQAHVGGSDGARVSLAEYAFRTPPLFKPAKEMDSSIRLQLYQTPDAPLVLEAGQQRITRLPNGQFAIVGDRSGLILFRVVEAMESVAPATLAEVHEQVVADLREQRAYARMEEQARQLYTAARKVGLTDALAMAESLKTKLGVSAVATPNPFARKNAGDLSTMSVDAIGPSEEFLTAVFSMAAADWTPTEPESPSTPDMPALTTRPAVEPAPKVTLISLPKLKKRVVVEFLELAPLTEDRFTANVRSSAYQQLFQRRARETMTDWFLPANIEKRCGFELLINEGDRMPIEGIDAPPAGDAPI